MPKRSNIVAKLPTDLDSIERPRAGQRWYKDAHVVPLKLRVSRLSSDWIYHGRIKDVPRRMLLGSYPRMDIDAARAAASRIASEGKPASVPLTFNQLRLAYIESAEFKALAPRTQESYAWVLRTKYYDGLKNRKIASITRTDLLAIKDAIAADDKAYQNVLRPAQALFSWALDREFIDASPATRLKLPANEADPQPYTEYETGAMLQAIRKAPEPWKTLYLLVAHSGQRPSTWMAALWSEVDFSGATLTVSRMRGSRSKRGKGWAIPLSKPVVAMLRAMRKAQGREANKLVFGRVLIMGQKARDKIAKAAGMLDDEGRANMKRFRSTMLDRLNKWRVPPETQMRMAGHASAFDGVREHYIVPAPSDEMHELAEKYADWLAYCELL